LIYLTTTSLFSPVFSSIQEIVTRFPKYCAE
jgi:hypothetical protein